MPDITFLGKFFKPVKSAKESSSAITQTIPDLKQTGYKEFRILRIPGITFLGHFSKAVKSAEDKESSSAITETTPDLTQTGYKNSGYNVYQSKKFLI